MTNEERWADMRARAVQYLGEDPGPRMPSMTEWAIMYLIAGIYWLLYKLHGPDACGEPGTEPRDTWDRGGTFGEGFRAMWGI